MKTILDLRASPIWILMLMIIGTSSSVAARLHGTVRTTEGEPIADAFIQAGFALPTQSRGDGTYDLEIHSGIWSIDVSFLTASIYRPMSVSEIVLCDDLELNFDIEPYQFPRRIHGRVISGRTGLGESASVSASAHIGMDTVMLSTNADSSGEFAFPVFPGEWVVVITPSPGSGELPQSFHLSVLPDMDTVIVLPTLAADREVFVRVLDAAGLEMPSQFVFVKTADKDSETATYKQTDFLGRFSLWLSDGLWEFTTYIPWPAPDSAEFLDVVQTFAVTDVTTNFVFQIPPYPPAPPIKLPVFLPWGGRVMDELGTPLTNMTISSTSGAATNTGENGSFTLLIPDWLQELSLNPGSNFVTPTLRVIPNTNLIESMAHLVVHHATSRLDLDVRTTSGEPVVSGLVTVSTYSNGLLYSVTAQTDCQGHSTLTAFPGQWLLRVESPKRTNITDGAATRFVTLLASTTNLSFTVPVEPRSTVFHGNIIDERGNPPFARIWLSTLSSVASSSSVALSEEFQIAGTGSITALLSAGRWTSSGSAQDGILPDLSLNIPPGTAATNLTWVIRQATNRIAVRVSNGTLGEFVTISASLAVGGSNYVATTFVLGTNAGSLRLFRGEWKITAYSFSSDPFLETSANVVISEANTTVELTFPPPPEPNAASVTIAGKVVDEFNKPIPFVGVGETTTLSDGTFLLNVQPGEQLLGVLHPLLPITASVQLSVEPGVSTNISLVLPSDIVPIECVVSNLISVPIYASGQLGRESVVGRSLPLENQHSILFLPRGQWNVSADDWFLNGRGFQSLQPVALTVNSATNLTFNVMPLTEKWRSPTHKSHLQEASLVVEIQSEVEAEYALEESVDFSNWSRLQTLYTTGGRANVVRPLQGNRFYRAIWLP